MSTVTPDLYAATWKKSAKLYRQMFNTLDSLFQDTAQELETLRREKEHLETKIVLMEATAISTADEFDKQMSREIRASRRFGQEYDR